MESFDTSYDSLIYEGHEPYVFVSYSHADTDKQRDILKILTKNKIRFWYDKGLHSGGDFNRDIAHHLEKASALILILSPNSANSEYVKDELFFAKEHKIPIHILKVKNFKIPSEVEINIIRLHSIDMNGDYEYSLLKSLPPEVYENGEIPPKPRRIRPFSKKTIIIFSLVIAVALFLAIFRQYKKFDPEIATTTASSTQTDTPDSGTVPDFLNFANGYATKISDETNNQNGTRKIIYEIDENKCDAITEEYIRLLKSRYNFSPIYENEKSDWFCFRLNGSSSDGFELYFSENKEKYSGINLSLFLYTEDNKKLLQFYVNDDIRMITNEKASFADSQKAEIADFRIYASLPTCYKSTDNSGKIVHEFIFSKNEYTFNSVKKIVTSYFELLAASHNFEKAGESNLGKENKYFCWAEYNGYATVTVYKNEVLAFDNSKISSYSLSMYIFEDGSDIKVKLYTAPEIQIIDTGDIY